MIFAVRALPLLAVSAGALLACEVRSPGPLPEDAGKVTYWQVVDASLNFAMCTDDETLRGDFTTPQTLIGSFLTYRVEEGARTATALECTSTEPASCGPSAPPRVFNVSGNELRSSGAPEEIPVVGFDCRQSVQTDWILVDQGEELSLDLVTRYNLTGTATACAALDDVFIQGGTNGLGIQACVVTLSARADFFEVR